MTVPQQKFREIVFQMLYSYDISHAKDDDMLTLLMEELSVPRQAVKDAQERVHNIFQNLQKIDSLIAKASLSYAFERIQSVERNILRLGAFELLFDDSIPPKVAIAEAMRLARKFSSPESSAFVNAILDDLYKSQQGLAADTSNVELTIQKLIQSEEAAKNARKSMDEKN